MPLPKSDEEIVQACDVKAARARIRRLLTEIDTDSNWMGLNEFRRIRQMADGMAEALEKAITKRASANRSR